MDNPALVGFEGFQHSVWGGPENQSEDGRATWLQSISDISDERVFDSYVPELARDGTNSGPGGSYSEGSKRSCKQ